MSRFEPLRFAVCLGLSSVFALAGLSCASGPGMGRAWGWFGPPNSHDVWSEAIEEWQARSDGELPAVAEAAARALTETTDAPPTLALAYLDFRREQRVAYARQVTDWIQEQARQHFVADGESDHWATVDEVLEADGDDCDGLAVLAYHLLREAGFADEELYQAIVYRASDDQYHMVTLWFEHAADPWVIDPTAAMTEPMVRMSSIADWRPLKIFSEHAEYTVRRTRRLPAVAAPPPGAD